MVAFWDKGWRQLGERKSRGWRGSEQREKDASTSPRLVSRPTSFVPRRICLYSIKQELACAGPTWKEQTDSGVSLPSKNIWRPSPQPPDPWRFLVPHLLLGVLSCFSASSLGNFIPILHLQIPWGSQCPSFLGYKDLPTSNPGNRVSHSLDLLFLFYKD